MVILLQIVSERMREAAKDIRLRPGLLIACQVRGKEGFGHTDNLKTGI